MSAGESGGRERRSGRVATLALLASAVCTCAAGGEPSPAQAGTPAPPPATLAKIEDFAPPEEFVMVGPLKTHLVRKGDSGRPVVLVHGFGSSTYTWRKTLDALAPRYQVFAFDLKGFGLTAKPKDGRYHMEAYTDHLLGLLDTLKLDKPVLVGHSLGGAVVTRFALLHPERVGALVLVSPLPVAMPRDVNAMKRVGGVEVGTAAETAAKLNPKLASRMLPALLRTTITRKTVETGLKAAYHDPKFVTPEMVEIYYRPITIEGAAEAIASLATPPPPPPPLPPMDVLKFPALVAWGGHDAVVPRSGFELYAKSIPGARSIVFENSGHVPHEEEADAFNTRLAEFLGSLP